MKDFPLGTFIYIEVPINPFEGGAGELTEFLFNETSALFCFVKGQVMQLLFKKTWIFPGSCRLADPPLERAGGRGTHFPVHLFYFWNSCFFVGWSRGPGRYLIFCFSKFNMECNQNHVCGPLGVHVMTIFVRTYIFAKIELANNHG